MANKCDRPDKVIESERGRALAEQHGLSYFETSAKTGQNVADVFNHIAKIIIHEKMKDSSTTLGMNGSVHNGGKNNFESKNAKLKVDTKKQEEKSEGGCCK